MSRNNPIEDAMQYAAARLQEADKRFREARADLARWQEAFDALQRLVTEGKEGNGKPIPHENGGGSLADVSGPEAFERVVREAGGKPMHLKVAIRRMQERGFPVKDTRRMYSSLYTSLTRQRHRFKKTGRGKFGLVKHREETN